MNKENQKGMGVNGIEPFRKLQRLVMVLMVPFLVIWLIAMVVAFAIYMPYMLLSMPIAGVGVWVYRRTRKKIGKQDDPNHTSQPIAGKPASG